MNLTCWVSLIFQKGIADIFQCRSIKSCLLSNITSRLFSFSASPMTPSWILSLFNFLFFTILILLRSGLVTCFRDTTVHLYPLVCVCESRRLPRMYLVLLLVVLLVSYFKEKNILLFKNFELFRQMLEIPFINLLFHPNSSLLDTVWMFINIDIDGRILFYFIFKFFSFSFLS